MELMYKLSLRVEEERQALKDLSLVKAEQIKQFRAKVNDLEWWYLIC